MVPAERMCKLELLQLLVVNDWSGGASPVAEMKANTKKRRFVDSVLTRPHSYLQVCYLIDTIFSKPGDLTKIYHNRTNMYYKCLLLLDDLACMAGTDGTWSDKDFGGLLKGRGKESDTVAAGARTCFIVGIREC